MRKKIIPLLNVIVLVALNTQSLHAKGQFPSSSKVLSAFESFGIQKFQEKKKATPFSLKNMNGNQISLSQFKGKPVMLMFWATWCSACKEEISLIEKFSPEKREQLTILLLAIDGEKKKRIQRVIQDLQITLSVLLDEDEKIARIYGVNFIPTAFLIDEEGLLVGKIVGQRDWLAPEAWPAIKEVLPIH